MSARIDHPVLSHAGGRVDEALGNPVVNSILLEHLDGDLRDRFEEGSISIPRDKHLIRELANLRYELDSRGRVQIWSKQRMKKENIPSPDRAEALMLGFGDYYPEEEAKKPKTWTQKRIDKTNKRDVEQDPWLDYAKKNLKEVAGGDFLYDDDEFAGFRW